MAFEFLEPGDGPAWTPRDLHDRITPGVIVYGTVREAGVNRYVAEQLQARLREGDQREFPIYKDFEAPASLMGMRDVVFVGRPDTNSALAEWSEKIGLDYSGASFRIQGKAYASERQALVFAAKNPIDAAHMVLVYAGNSPLATVEALQASAQAAYIVLEDGKPTGPSTIEEAANRRQ